MRVVIVGHGVQGIKRHTAAGDDVVAIVDPAGADHIDIGDVRVDYDAALVCTDYLPKYDIVSYLLAHGKHVLVEKPLWVPKAEYFDTLELLAWQNNCVLYTAYNHRFEPAFRRMRATIKSDHLGRIYRCRMSYGFGVAALVWETWRDRPPANILWEICPHLLDAARWWFGYVGEDFDLVSSQCFETDRPDHAVIVSRGLEAQLEFEASYVSWRNHFTCDVYGEEGSAHIDGLCKWGPASFTYRRRVLPSGKPAEVVTTLHDEDATWREEYKHFKQLIADKTVADLSNDRWIYRILTGLSSAMSA